MQTDEIWRPIKDFYRYKISNLGRVKSMVGSGRRSDKILSLNYSPSGYRSVHLTKDKKGYAFRVHRLVLEAFIGPPEGNNICHHKDENKANNRLDNLEWSNQSKNILASSKRVVNIVDIRN